MAMSSLDSDTTVSSIDADIEKPRIDDRIYHQFKLTSNGIPVTVVQDYKSQKSSCSLAVRVGAAADSFPGTAHITEHAVFLGSEKYPVENAYKNFLNQHGGQSNAGTGMEHTTYKFSVNAAAFDHALDIFSQFFKKPLFRTDAMSREIMAVDSEDSKNRILDGRRMLQVLKHQIKPSSAYAKFSTGNLKTLVFGDVDGNRDQLSDLIKGFHAQHYHPNQMAVCLVGPQSITELQRMAELHFSNIAAPAEHNDGMLDGNDDSKAANRVAATTLTSTGTAYADAAEGVTPEVSETDKLDFTSTASPTVSTIVPNAAKSEQEQQQQQQQQQQSLFVHGGNKLLRVRPIKDIRDLTIIWELPETRDLYRRNPCYLIGFLLAQKGVGSWFAALQDKGWATGTSAGMRSTFSDFTLFEATATLTEEGLAHWEEIHELLYRSVDVLNAATDQEFIRIWTEMRTLNAIDFFYRQKSTPYQLAPQLAANMLQYPLNHILSAGWVLESELDIGLTRSFLSKLTAQKSLVVLRSRTFESLIGNDDVNYIDTVYNYVDKELSERADVAAVAGAKQSGQYFDFLREFEAAQLIGDLNHASTTTDNVDNVDNAAAAACAAASAKDDSSDVKNSSPSTAIAIAIATTTSSDSNTSDNAAHDTRTQRSVVMKMEPFYGVPYAVEELISMMPSTSTDHIDHAEDNTGVRNSRSRLGRGDAADQIDRISDIELHLPAENVFICTELLSTPAESRITDDYKNNDNNDNSEAPAVGSMPKSSSTATKLHSSPPVRYLAASTHQQQLQPVEVDGTTDSVGEQTAAVGKVNEAAAAAAAPFSVNIWHSHDEVFGQPRSAWFTLIKDIPACDDGHPVLSLISSVFGQITARKYYQAGVAGLSYGFSVGQRGIALTFHGFSPRLPKLASEVSKDVGSIAFWDNVDQSVFGICKERLLRSLRSWTKERPDSQCDSLMRYLLQERTWLPSDRLAALENTDFETFQQRIHDIILPANPDTTVRSAVEKAAHPGHVSTTTTAATNAAATNAATAGGAGSEYVRGAEAVCYSHGDLPDGVAAVGFTTILQHLHREYTPTSTTASSSTASSSAASAATTSPATASPVAAQSEGVGKGNVNVGERARLLPTGEHHVVALPAFNPDDPNSALVTHIQIDAASPRTTAVLLFLRRLLGEPAFAQLRTKKQLGYIVSLFASGYGRGWGSMRGITVRILSKRFSPLTMEKELGDFLSQELKNLIKSPPVPPSNIASTASTASTASDSTASTTGAMGAASGAASGADDQEEQYLTESRVRTICDSIIVSLQDPPTTYSEEASEYWDAIVSQMPFDWVELVIEELKHLQRKDIVTAIQTCLLAPSQRRSVSMMVFGPSQQHELDSLKQQHELGSLQQQQQQQQKQQQSSEACTNEGVEEKQQKEDKESDFFRNSEESTSHYHFSVDALTALKDSLEVYNP